MPRDGQELFPRTIGEVLALLLRAKWPHHTAKKVEAKYELAEPTAKNVVKGHVSERSLTTILRGEGEDVFELLDAIGHALTGKTRQQWEEEKFQRIIEEAARAQERVRWLRTRRELLAESAGTVDEAASWQTPDPHGREAHQARPGAG